MTKAEAVQRIGRLLWGLRFVEERMEDLGEARAFIAQACFLVNSTLGSDWRNLVEPDDAASHLDLTTRLLKMDHTIAENLVAIVNKAQHDGFAGLRRTTDEQLIEAVADMHYWEAIYTFFASPGTALTAIGAAMGTAFGAMLGGLLKSPATIALVIFVYWYVKKGRK